MFEIPALYNTISQLIPISRDDLQPVLGMCADRSVIPCDEDIFYLCCHLMSVNGLQVPLNVDTGLEIYVFLRNAIKI